jgi:hypothetical protein
MVALSNCIFEVVKAEGTATLITLTTTEFDVEVQPDGEVIVKVYVPETIAA